MARFKNAACATCSLRCQPQLEADGIHSPVSLMAHALDRLGVIFSQFCIGK
jgi:hypothetical protein